MKTRRGLFLGRFQPYHNGHEAVIEHIVKNKEVDELIIAVGSAQYSHTLRDPFTAGERIMMITKALEALELSITAYVLPIVDIERHSLYVAHMRTLAPPFSVVYSNNPLVQRLFHEAGIEVKQVPFVKRHDWWGTKIRDQMLQGEEWRKLVPKAVCQVIDEINGIQRLRHIAKTDRIAQNSSNLST